MEILSIHQGFKGLGHILLFLEAFLDLSNPWSSLSPLNLSVTEHILCHLLSFFTLPPMVFGKDFPQFTFPAVCCPVSTLNTESI